MSLTPWEERQILQDIIDGLAAAIYTSDDWAKSDIDPIKFNKLLYLAIQEFDIPITYRWYKYGYDVTHIGKGLEDLEPKALKDLPSPEEPSIVDDWEVEPYDYPSPEEYQLFYLHQAPEIDEIFENDTKEYLGEFYDNYAPEEYEDLYVASAVFQKTLDSIGREDNPGSVLYDSFSELDEELRHLEAQVADHPKLADSLSAFLRYADLFHDVMATVYQKNGDLSDTEEESLVDAIKFFYEEAWRFVALEIAEDNNLGGSNRRRLLDKTIAKLDELDKNFTSQLHALRRGCLRDGAINDDLDIFDVTADRLETAYQRKEDEDLETAEKWRYASSEANERL